MEVQVLSPPIGGSKLSGRALRSNFLGQWFDSTLPPKRLKLQVYSRRYKPWNLRLAKLDTQGLR